MLDYVRLVKRGYQKERGILKRDIVRSKDYGKIRNLSRKCKPLAHLVDYYLLSKHFLYFYEQEPLIIHLPILLPYEEKRLLRQLSKGDEKAFRALYDAYFDHLSAFVFKICKSTEATEEIVQDVFVKLWINRQNFSHIDSPEAYIFSMARNRTIDHLHRLAKDTGLISVLTGQLSSMGNEIEEKLNAKELGLLIREALGQLSIQKRTIFQLSKEQGLSHDEIAEVMHLSKSTVKNHLSETLRHIREHLSRQPNSEATLLIILLLENLR